ncbi:FxSxx-COOH system tetratricopeptide repeat protein [Streptomyces sp. NPDC052043]|uniref:FxSxx-COOH system tetratricopeptide repeat protein n=1 Tax=Streptomyces sp. NPDC052043 TaxID=3365684 RepID=UPI0037D48391
MAAAAESIFVSYAGPDRAWAEWAAWHLREAGHHVEIDVWDWRTGDNFVERMNDAMRRATTVVALFSNNYFDRTRWTREEWTSIVARRERLIPLTIAPLAAAEVPDILSAVLRKDLHGLDEQAAIAALLDAVKGPTGPNAKPVFPGAPAPARTSPAGSSSQRPRLPSGARVVPHVWNVPDRNPHFIGREAQLAQIRDGLLGGQRAVVQALHGLGGIGKTQIAREYAHRFASQYDTVWWIDAEQADQIHTWYTELAARLSIAKPDAGAEHNARTLLEHLRAQDRWLIILDNADDPQDLEGLIPSGPGHVLITSRNPGWSDRVHGLNLGVFTRSDSLAYLAARVPLINPEQADGLADDLGDLPLALAQAAGVITSGMTVDRYRVLLAEKTAKLMDNGGPHSYPTPLAAAVDIATIRLAADRSDAAELLRLGAYFGPDSIPIAWLEAALDQLAIDVDPDDFMWPQAALQLLARYGLARLDHETFQIHRLTQAILRDRSTEADATVAEDDVTTILKIATPQGPEAPATWPQWAALTSHLTARKYSAANRPQLRPALIQAARYLITSGQPRAARELTTTLHHTWTRTLGDDHEDTLTSAQHLCHAMSDLAEYAEARRMQEDILERRRAVLGDDHPDTLQSANDLAVNLNNLGQRAEALRMHYDTLERRRTVLGDDHPDTLHSAQNVAGTLYDLGQYAEARRMTEDILERRRTVLGDDHPETLRTAYGLASTLHNLGQHAEARRMAEDILERRRTLLGDDHPDTLRSAHGLATTLHSLGQPAEARRMHDDTLERRRTLLGDDHPDTLRTAHGLATTLHSLGQHAEARRMAEDTLERRRTVLGDDHPDTLRTAHGLATTLHSLGQHAEARRMHDDTLERRRTLLGDDHPETLRSALGLATTLGALREHVAPVRLLKDTRARSRRTLGNGHKFTEAVTQALARALTAAGKPHEAQRLLASLKTGPRQTRRKR